MSSPKNTFEILTKSAVGDERDIIDCMVEVELNEEKFHNPFLSVKEALGRIGIQVSRRDAKTEVENKTLYQTCHILSHRGKYYIVHFKHLYILDGRINGLHKEDVMRMNRIIWLLESWGMLKIKHPEQITDMAEMKHIRVIKYDDLANWSVVMKYNMNPRKENRH